jgi:cell division protein FtsI/penicillin-binding protein 2
MAFTARSAARVLLLSAACIPNTAWTQATQLFSQAASAVLEQQFNRSELSWLLVDNSGGVLAQHWDAGDTPVSPGSLVKPFLAVAYGQQHGFVYPRLYCAGSKSRCWLPRGHGWLGIEAAIGQSCNGYFLTLADRVDRGRATQTFAHFGLRGPPADAPNRSLIGLGDDWKETPLALARAYLALLHESAGGEEFIARGMATAADTGTARSVNAVLGQRAAFAKTGTAVCSHHPRAAADGFTVVLYPAAQPRVLLLVRMHGATGAQTAAVAGQMMQAIGQGLR